MGKNDAALLIEYFDDKFEKLLEGVEAVIDKRVRIIVKEELEPIKVDIKVIKAAVKETNNDVQELDKRVTTLEAA